MNSIALPLILDCSSQVAPCLVEVLAIAAGRRNISAYGARPAIKGFTPTPLLIL
jgi:hypothetical protein